MKRTSWLVAALLVMVMALAAWGQAPLRPQDGAAAGVVKSLKWSYGALTVPDTMKAVDSTAWVEIYTAEWLWNRWSLRVQADTLKDSTETDSLSFQWSYQLYPGAAWATTVVAGQITAGELTGQVIESYLLNTSSLTEKPYKIRVRCRSYGAGKYAWIEKMEVIQQ